MAKDCPCGSGFTYAACCAPYHRGVREAPTAEALMRSRFAAFAAGEAEYLWRTLHSSHPDRALPKAEVVRALTHACRTHKYMRLAILDAREDRVLFRAEVFEKGKDRSFVELSEFAKEEGGWRYVGGDGRAAKDVPDATLTIDTFSSLPP